MAISNPRTKTIKESCRRPAARFIRGLVCAAVISAGVGATQPASAQTCFQLNPQATYLVHPDSAAQPLTISLSSVGARPGDCIRIEQFGEYDCNYPFAPCTARFTAAVFSSTADVLERNSRYRVPGAVVCGLVVPTGPNCGPNGTSQTDIPEDFRIDPSVTVLVPPGAVYLILGTPDCWNTDNRDFDGNYAVCLTICRADFNCSGTLSVQDIFDFLAGYFGGDTRADFNASGAISVQDIFDFLAGYFAGCN